MKSIFRILLFAMAMTTFALVLTLRKIADNV